MKDKITRTLLKQQHEALLASNKARLDVWDTLLPGFGARVSRSGSISYVLNYRDGQQRLKRLVVGTDAELTPEGARKRAAGMKLEVRAGGDPLEDKRKRAVVGLTVADACQQWLEYCEGRLRPATVRDYRQSINHDILPMLGKIELAALSKGDITAAINKVSKRSAAVAAKFRRTIGACLNWAVDAEMMESAPLPKASRVAPAVKARQRVVTDAELRTIWQAADTLSPRSAALTRFVMLTALRMGAAQRLQYSWIDGATITVPAEVMKGDRQHVLTLSDWAMEQLAPALALPPAGPFVFSDGPDAPDRENKVKKLLRARTGIDDWTWHDFRRSFRTWAAAAGIPRDHADATLAHRSNRTSLDDAYDQYHYKKEIFESGMKWQEHLRKTVT